MAKEKAKAKAEKKPRAKKKKSKEVKSEMFVNLNRILESVSREKGIPMEALIEAIESAFLTAARKKWGHLGELEAHYNEETGEIELFQFKTVVENVVDENIEMTIEEGKKLDPEAEFGDSLGVKMDPSVFGRIAAQTAKQVIIQKIKDAERSIVYEEFKDRVGELVTGIVRRFERGDAMIDLGRTEAMLPRSEQVPNEQIRIGERVQGYFLEVNKPGKGPQLILSRKDPRLVARLFEMEVPEIADNIVEVRSLAREPGFRCKIAVYSNDSDVDPIGACVGMKGSRVQSVVQELKGEKIDIVAWDEDPARFVCNAIAPAEVVKVIVKERENVMEVVVPDDQLSLAIGKRGQNVRLAAELCGWNIDVLSETKIEELSRRHQEALTRLLGVEKDQAFVLYNHGYRGIEEIQGTKLEEFVELPGINRETLGIMHAKAVSLVANGKTTASVVAEIAVVEDAVKAEEAAAKAAEEAARAEEEAAKAAEEAAKAAEVEAEAEAEAEAEVKVDVEVEEETEEEKSEV